MSKNPQLTRKLEFTLTKLFKIFEARMVTQIPKGDGIIPRSDLRCEAQFQKLWEWCLFATPHIFANGPHLVAHTQLRPTKTPSKLPRSHFSPKRRLVPYAYPSFDILWPIPISLFVSLSVCKRSFGLVYAQF